MKRLLLIAVFSPLLAYAGFGATERDWEFMQSVGGISLGVPFKNNDGIWKLPIECNVAGIRTFTTKPTAMNSGIGVARIQVQHQNHEILLTVVTGSARDATCGAATLGSLSHGKYRVIYRSPDGRKNSIGEVSVG